MSYYEHIYDDIRKNNNYSYRDLAAAEGGFSQALYFGYF